MSPSPIFIKKIISAAEKGTHDLPKSMSIELYSLLSSFHFILLLGKTPQLDVADF